MAQMSAYSIAHPNPPREVQFRGGGFVISSKPFATPLAFFIVILIWEGAVRTGLLNPIFLPAPSAIVKAFADLAVSGALWQHVSISLQRIGIGWALGSATGIAIGIAMGLWSVTRTVGLAFVSALFPIPKIALLPLFILWLGIGETSKIAIIATGVFFPTTIAVYSGVDAVPRNLIRMAQSFGVPSHMIVWKVVLPSAMPSILSGFRISIATALLLLVSAEMIGAQYGIGAFILQTGNMMLTDQLLAGVALLSIAGLSINVLLVRLERWLFRWR